MAAKVDLNAARKELAKKLDREPSETELLSYLLYPQVFMDYQKHLDQYANTSVLPTHAFFYGLQRGEEISVEIEPGKVLVVKFLTVSDPHDDGTRTVFYELNGQPREVKLPDRITPDDANIAQRALSALDWNVAVPKGRVKLTVAQGWITLEGEVEWYYQKNAAEDAVRI